jgi:hypothetical protein
MAVGHASIRPGCFDGKFFDTTSRLADTLRGGHSTTPLSMNPVITPKTHDGRYRSHGYRGLLAVLVLAASLPCPAPALAAEAEAPKLESHLEPLRGLLGKTWKGPFSNSKPEKPTVDVSRWERALNGKAVRVLHSINDGAYGGETIILWDPKKNVLVSHYFTTAGFTTTGTITFRDGKIISHEVVTGSSVSEVRAISELKPDGTLHVKSEHLKNGEWEPGHEVIYKDDPEAKVIFR